MESKTLGHFLAVKGGLVVKSEFSLNGEVNIGLKMLLYFLDLGERYAACYFEVNFIQRL